MSVALDREGLRRLAEAATSGPWRYSPVKPDHPAMAAGLHAPGDEWCLGTVQTDADAAYIVAAVNAVPALLDALAAAEAAVARGRDRGGAHGE